MYQDLDWWGSVNENGILIGILNHTAPSLLDLTPYHTGGRACF